MADSFINSATGTLVQEIAQLVHSQPAFRESTTIADSFRAFRHTCTVTPAIVGYIGKRTAVFGRRPVFNADQFELLMLAMIARSSSTYGTIPGVVAHLALIGEHADAAILNENAKNETGDRAHAPHPVLLYDGFAVIGEAMRVPVLTPARYHIMRLILIGRTALDDLADARSVAAYLADRELHVPSHDEEDIRIALHYADKHGPDLIELHSRVIEAESRVDERKEAGTSRNPYDRKWLALRCLELAMREASSVDEHEANRLSYIGAWGQVVEHMAPLLPTCELARARAWTEAHNDEAAGQAVGWDGAAEEGHAEDARSQALKMIAALSPPAFASVLDEVTNLNDLRIRFWDEVVRRLAAIDDDKNATGDMVAAQ